MVSTKYRRGGFTLVELMVVVGVLAIIAAIAIPRLMEARLQANEGSAIATLRSIAQAQTTFQQSTVIDTDGDGVGEYGYFGELSGKIPCRISVAGAPALGVVGTDELSPPLLPEAFGNVTVSQITRSGYVFQIYLPAELSDGKVIGIPEDPTGGKSVELFPYHDSAEQYWCAYAWSLDAGTTGRRTFFVNQNCEIAVTMAYRAYSGADNAPNFGAAYSAPGDMSSRIAIGEEGNDGNFWVIVP